MGDKTPVYDASSSWLADGYLPSSNGMPLSEIKHNMSRNHGGELINLLTGDGRADGYNRPDAYRLSGGQPDCVYTSFMYGGVAMAQGATVTDPTADYNGLDCCLIGPFPYDP